MKVILLTDVKKVGRRHEVCDVADGYAQNVLLPKKLGLPATPENIKRFQKEEGRAADKKAYDETLLIKNIKDLDGTTIAIQARANESGKLFQTIHPKNVLEVIKKDFNIELPERAVQMDDIKQVGEYTATLTVGKVKTSLNINIPTN